MSAQSPSRSLTFQLTILLPEKSSFRKLSPSTFRNPVFGNKTSATGHAKSQSSAHSTCKLGGRAEGMRPQVIGGGTSDFGQALTSSSRTEARRKFNRPSPE